MIRNTTAAIVSLIAGSVLATAAYAHPKLVKSVPAADTVVSVSPKELRLSFNEELVPKFSSADVKDQKGRVPVAPRQHHVRALQIIPGEEPGNPTDKKQMVVPLAKPLVAGTYMVEWHAVAADTHRVQGTYSFTVKQ
jgi:methionine-rich copper-binding protein CopC